MYRHGAESYFVIGEGLFEEGDDKAVALAPGQPPPFRFARMGPKGNGKQLSLAVRKRLASAINVRRRRLRKHPGRLHLLGQFIDHDLTFDKTSVMLGQRVSPAAMLQGRSPSLDLDSLYGAGPLDPVSEKFYRTDKRRLNIGKTVAAGGYPVLNGFDLPRGAGTSIKAKRKAIIPDFRNDENLAVAQTHTAFIRFHNRIVDTLPGSVPPAQRFGTARELAIKHYQWMIRHDFLPRICTTGAQRRLQPRPKGVRGGGQPDRCPGDADRVLHRRLPARALDDPSRLQLEQALRRRGRVPGVPVHLLRDWR